MAERATAPLLILAFLACLAPFLHGQRKEATPRDLEGVGVDEKLDQRIDLDLVFRDQDGAAVRLGDLFADGKPVIVTMNYASCPMLCGLQLNGLVATLSNLEYVPGEEFRIVTVSVDPSEQPAAARHAQRTYVKRLGKPEAAAGWRFLVGDEGPIRSLADDIGFRYRFVESTGEFAHAAVAVVCTPDGRVSRYLYGVQIPERTLKFSLVEAARGEIGTTLDQILLFCFHYDSSSGSYVPTAMNLMRIGGAVVLALVSTMLIRNWRRERRRRDRPVTPAGRSVG